jgi:hypothetical protein
VARPAGDGGESGEWDELKNLMVSTCP